MAVKTSADKVCIPSLNVLFQLRYRSDANDGAGHTPALVAKSQRHLGRRHAIVSGKLVVKLCSG
jgi:hypothetical protein